MIDRGVEVYSNNNPCQIRQRVEDGMGSIHLKRIDHNMSECGRNQNVHTEKKKSSIPPCQNIIEKNVSVCASIDREQH